MAKQKETYPVVTPDNAAVYTAILDQYRQSITAGAPHPIEWLTASITEGLVLPLEDFNAELREGLEAVAKAEAAAQAAREAAVEWLGETEEELTEAEAPAEEEQQADDSAAAADGAPTGDQAEGESA